MKFNAATVLANYERSVYIDDTEVKYVLYPSNSDKMLICFTTLGPNIYERIRMFWNEDESWDINYLFISDNNGEHKGGLYYLGNNENYYIEKQTMALIDHVCNQQNIKTMYTIGSSMGGYAAIYYGLKLKLDGVIAVVPQVNKEIIEQLGWQKWKKVLKEVGSLPDLCQLIACTDTSDLPDLFIQYGTYPADLAAGEALKEVLVGKNGLFVFDCFDKSDHTSDFMTKELVDQILNLFAIRSDQTIKGGIR